MKKKIFIIDDDEAIVESLTFLLEESGYEVMTAMDGSFIEQKLQQQKPDLIILDYWLPRQNGGEITKKLKSIDHIKQIPIIIVSASYNIKDVVEKAGADEFIAKPYDADFILNRIENFIPQ